MFGIPEHYLPNYVCVSEWEIVAKGSASIFNCYTITLLILEKYYPYLSAGTLASLILIIC